MIIEVSKVTPEYLALVVDVSFDFAGSIQLYRDRAWTYLKLHKNSIVFSHYMRYWQTWKCSGRAARVIVKDYKRTSSITWILNSLSLESYLHTKMRLLSIKLCTSWWSFPCLITYIIASDLWKWTQIYFATNHYWFLQI